MSEVLYAGVVACMIVGFIQICRWIVKLVLKILRREPIGEKPAVNQVRLSRAEVEQIMMQRAQKGDKMAEDWLIRNGYTKELDGDRQKKLSNEDS